MPCPARRGAAAQAKAPASTLTAAPLPAPQKIVRLSFKEEKGAGPVFNNASQVWNHSFFWLGQKAGGGGAPPKAVADALDASFGSYAKFAEEFKAAALAQFGSGWAWLVYNPESKRLAIAKTPNAESPLVAGAVPLLTCDVWEHAYYLDHENRRAGAAPLRRGAARAQNRNVTHLARLLHCVPGPPGELGVRGRQPGCRVRVSAPDVAPRAR